jgi:hypothetical protein
MPPMARGDRTVLLPHDIFASADATDATLRKPGRRTPLKSVISAPKSQGDLASGAIDEATAQFLRPLLLQWMDSNLMQIMERAIELETKDLCKSK